MAILTGTLGKALGGAVGGFTVAAGPVVEYLRQRSRPYLFSNTLPPMVALAALKGLELAGSSSELRDRLHANARRLRRGLAAAGFQLKPGEHPIIPVMLGDAALASRMADLLLQRGIYAISFSYPVVPQGQARIRLQASAAHTPEQIDKAVAAFTEVGASWELCLEEDLTPRRKEKKHRNILQCPFSFASWREVFRPGPQNSLDMG